MGHPPPEPEARRRYWDRYNRPYTGCGCVYAIAVLAVLYAVLALIWPALAFWS